MTFKDLEQIIYMKSEIDMLNKRLQREQSKGSQFVGDYAKDYSTGQGRVITIQGYALADSKKVNEIWRMLETRKRILEEKVLEAERYIASIADSKIRTLFTRRFLEGKSWEETGQGKFFNMSEDAARKMVKRYFEKNSEKISKMSDMSVSDVL